MTIAEYLQHRRHVFLWILQVVNNLKLSVAVRDTCIKLLDGYYCKVRSDTIIEVTRESVSCVAVVSLFTAIKMMDPQSPVTLDSLSDYDKSKLEALQPEVLSCIIPQVITRYPSSPPSVIMNNFLLQFTVDESLRSSIYVEADKALVDFLIHDSSIDYVEMTMAVCALIIGFSVLQINCKDFIMNVVPDNFFNYGNGRTLLEKFDQFNTCIQIFKTTTLTRRNNSMASNDTLAGNSNVGSNQQHDVDTTATGYIDHIHTNCFLLNFYKFLYPAVPLDVMNMFIATLTHADFPSSKILKLITESETL